jgi:predicted transcriptional regulator
VGTHPERRDRACIYAEILENIYHTSSVSERPTVTRIQTRVNVPFVRFKEYIDDLEKKNLIKLETEITLTEKGIEYLKEYKKVREFLERFGMIRSREDETDY